MELKEKIEKLLKGIYTPSSRYIEIATGKDSYAERRINDCARKLGNKGNYQDKAYNTYIMTAVLKQLIKMDHRNLNIHKELHKKWLEKILPILVDYNVEQVEKFLKKNRDISFDDLIKINKENRFKIYLKTGSLTAVHQYVTVPTQIKDKILKNIPEHPWDSYPKARGMFRHFYIHVGGTNTGKTYQSLERLKASESGAYLGPLRLLAMEVQDNLNSSGVPCNLLTGEQEETIGGATHVASTVEMADFDMIYDVVVIDECQMIEDIDRGGHWTNAIMGMRSHEIHLCMAPEALELCKKLIEDCGDTYEVVTHERFVPLEYEPVASSSFNFKKDLRDGDALIVFSRKEVLYLASELEQIGIHASVIYGALPYETRKKQVERFVNHETKVVVSTDAIGMGLNLPIHRVIFMRTEKFDGKITRMLQVEEIKQIAGRAGRRGMYDEGFVSSIENQKYIKKALTETVPNIEFANIIFPEHLMDIDASFQDILKVWYSMEDSGSYKKQDVNQILKLYAVLKPIWKKMDKHLAYEFCTIPFDEKNEELTALWFRYCNQYINGVKTLGKPKVTENSLYGYEVYYKALGLYHGFSRKMKLPYDEYWLRAEFALTSEKINTLLIAEMKKTKRCTSCHKPLPWDFKYNICEKCYYKRMMSFDRWEDY